MWASMWHLAKTMSARPAVCPQAHITRTLRAQFSADVTGFGHMILIKGPGNLAVEAPALCRESSSLFRISPEVINGCYVNVVLLNSQCTFILSNLLLDVYVPTEPG